MNTSDNGITEDVISDISDGEDEEEADESFPYSADQRPSEALREEIDSMMQNLPDNEFTKRVLDQSVDQYKAETTVEDCAANLDIAKSLIRSTKSFIRIYTNMIQTKKKAANLDAKNGDKKASDTDLQDYVKRLRKHKHQLLMLRTRRKKIQQEWRLAIQQLECSIRQSLEMI
mmetsp:Transcript_11699/g.28120  ORF Transcript_11699/g.28120 Transcript_11699/m.28120 type:complete len:173 (+) Transcript_11699:67-585(+)